MVLTLIVKVYLIDQINDSIYEGISFKINIDLLKTIKEKYLIMDKEESKSKNIFTLLEIGNLSGVPEYNIIKFIKVIGKHDSAEFVLSLSNGYFISGGNSKELIIYNQKIEMIKKIDLSFCPNNISEIKNRNNIINILCSSNDNVRLITLDDDEEYYEYSPISSNNCLEIGNNKYIICNTKGVYIIDNIFNKNINRTKIINNSYRAIKKINETIIVFTSNEVIPNGNDSLILYNLEYKKIIKKLDGFSFSLCTNSLLVMNNEKFSNQDKILICACKQYKRNQKNGLLLMSIIENKEKYHSFMNTNDYEPYCFCELLYVKNKDESYKTNYFLVGGFDKSKSRGGIKLNKINNNNDNNNNEITIEFIQDVSLENNSNIFSGAITCITQSKEIGNLIITSSDGSVNLFSPPNLNYYLFYDEVEKKEFHYDEIKNNVDFINKIKDIDTQIKIKFNNNMNYINLFL